MSVLLFSQEQVNELNKNPYVIRATDRRVTYTDEFKKLFVKQYREGITPSEIFYNAGFDVKALGYKRIEKASDRWRGMNNLGRFGEDAEVVTVHGSRIERKGKLENTIQSMNERIETLLKENAELRARITALEHGA